MYCSPDYENIKPETYVDVESGYWKVLMGKKYVREDKYDEIVKKISQVLTVTYYENNMLNTFTQDMISTWLVTINDYTYGNYNYFSLYSGYMPQEYVIALFFNLLGKLAKKYKKFTSTTNIIKYLNILETIGFEMEKNLLEYGKIMDNRYDGLINRPNRIIDFRIIAENFYRKYNDISTRGKLVQIKNKNWELYKPLHPSSAGNFEIGRFLDMIDTYPKSILDEPVSSFITPIHIYNIYTDYIKQNKFQNTIGIIDSVRKPQNNGFKCQACRRKNMVNCSHCDKKILIGNEFVYEDSEKIYYFHFECLSKLSEKFKNIIKNKMKKDLF